MVKRRQTIGIRLLSRQGDWVAVEAEGPFGELVVPEARLPLDKIRSLASSLRSRSVTETELYQLCHILGHVLLPSPLREHLTALLADEETRVRVKVRIDADWLARLPWEYCVNPDGSDALLLSDPRISMVRHEALDLPPADLHRREDARLTHASAAPRQQGLEPLDPDADFSSITEAVGGRWAIDQRTSVSGPDLLDILQSGTSIVHFCGHGADGQLLCHAGPGSDLPAWFDGAELARHRLSPSLRLVVLAACESGARDDGGWHGVARSLVNAGVPAVIAMPLPIEDNAATRFCSALYGALAGGADLDQAVGEARQAIRNTAMSDWAIPVVYTRHSEPDLFGGGMPTEAVEEGASSTRGSLGNLNVRAGETALAGRERILDELALEVERYFDAPDSHHNPPLYQVLTGMSGVGKSVLAGAHALDMAIDQRVDLVWWVRSEHEVARYTDLADLARHEKIPLADTDHRTADQVRDHLERTTQRWMLVFDNVAGLGEIQSLLPRVGNGAVVVTSVNSTGWRRLGGSRTVPPLEDHDAAARLLLELTGLDDKPGAVDLAHRLGHLPIALVSAAALIEAQGHDFRSFILRLERDLVGTMNNAFDTASAHAQVPEGVGWLLSQVVDEIPPTARRLLQVLSWFDPDSIPVEVLDSEVLAREFERSTPRDAFSELQQHGLVQTGPGNIGLHRLIQAAGQRSPDGLEPAGLRLAGAVLNELWPADPGTHVGTDSVTALHPHLSVVGAAMRHHGAPGASDVLALAGGSHRLRGNLITSRQVLEQWLVADPTHPRLRTELASTLAMADPGRAIALIDEIRDQLLSVGEPWSLDAYGLLGWLTRRDSVTEGHRITLEAKARWHELGLPHNASLADLVCREANVLMAMGRYEESLDLHREAIETLRGIETDHSRLSSHLSDQAIVLRRLGRLSEAVRCYRDAVTIAEERYEGRDNPTLDSALNNLGYILRVLGEAEEAVEVLQRAIDMALRCRDPRTVAVGTRMVNLGRALVDVGRPEEGIELAEGAVAIAREGDDWFRLGHRLLTLGACHRAAGNLPAAEETTRATLTALAQREGEPMRGDLGRTQSQLGGILASRAIDESALGEARSLLGAAGSQISEVFGDHHYEYAYHLIERGRLELAIGDTEAALTTLEAASTLVETSLRTGHPLLDEIDALVIRSGS